MPITGTSAGTSMLNRPRTQVARPIQQFPLSSGILKVWAARRLVSGRIFASLPRSRLCAGLGRAAELGVPLISRVTNDAPREHAHGSVATFAELDVPNVLVRRLAADGISSPFPIQTATLPDSLAGRDVLGRGRTGSGKTLAFALPLLTRIHSGSRARPGRPTALVLVPTRELATQVAAVVTPLARSMNLRTMTIFGGVPAGKQIRSLQAGVDIVVACPGRLEDLMSGGHVRLSAVRVTVIDEADHMADLGFLPAVRRLLDATPEGGQRLLFSATLDRDVDVLVKRYLVSPVRHEVDTAQSPVAAMTHHVLHVDRTQRVPVVADLAAAPGKTVIFTRTRRGASRLNQQLQARGIPAVELHGDLAQGKRIRNLAAFSSGRANTLVATDIAARGIHVDDVSLVVHADPPGEHKAYLHRSGRTARAGDTGTVVTLMTDDQRPAVRDLMRRAGIKPTISRCDFDAPILREIAPGERSLRPGDVAGDGRPARDSAPQAPRRGSKPPARARTGGGSDASPRGKASRRGTPATTRRADSGRASRKSSRQSTTRRQATPQHSATGFSAGLSGRGTSRPTR